MNRYEELVIRRLPPEQAELYRQERAREKAALQTIEQGIRTADSELFGRGLTAINRTPSSWRRAFLLIARQADVPDQIRRYFLERFWLHHGDYLRQEVGDDRLLMRGLRILLPPYTGPAMLLYRGESWKNRCRRTYGPPWSTSQAVAEDYAATGDVSLSHGGSVLLRTLAPPAAIICAPILECEDRYGEQEYLVDRSRLSGVEVLWRYPQLTIGERQALHRASPKAALRRSIRDRQPPHGRN
jgi:hypothetical protein